MLIPELVEETLHIIILVLHSTAALTLTGTPPASEDSGGPWSISITLSTPDPNRLLPPQFGSRVQQLPQACMVTVAVTGGSAARKYQNPFATTS